MFGASSVVIDVFCQQRRPDPPFPRHARPSRDSGESVAMSEDIAAFPSVIPAKAGIHPTFNLQASRISPRTLLLTELSPSLLGGCRR